MLGLGEAGRAAIKSLHRIAPGEPIVALDQHPVAVPKRVRRELTALGASVRLGDVEPDELGPRPQTVIKSPGVPPGTTLLKWAAGEGIEVLDELELGWRQHAAPLIGVTGTNGKTTTATLAAAALSRAGLEAVLAGNADTAPPLSAVAGDPDLIVCEISSFQLEGCSALVPEVGVFTNLSHDHLQRHGSMRRYGEVKRSMFIRGESVVRLAVIDTIGEFGQELAREIERAGGEVIRIGLDSRADYRIGKARWDLRRARLELDTPSGALSLETRLPGFYNARNVAAVTALADQLGCDRNTLSEMLAAHPGAIGRFEHIAGDQPCDVILDTAASADAVEQFLSAVRRGMSPGARLHAVLGVLGAPDPAHRRATGSAARRLCDRLILTVGSFRPKAPVRTLEPMIAGASSVAGAELTVLADREGAIDLALREALPGDVVAVMGRGNQVESVNDGKADDRGALRRALGRHRSGSPVPERAGQAARGQLLVNLQ